MRKRGNFHLDDGERAIIADDGGNSDAPRESDSSDDDSVNVKQPVSNTELKVEEPQADDVSGHSGPQTEELNSSDKTTDVKPPPVKRLKVSETEEQEVQESEPPPPRPTAVSEELSRVGGRTGGIYIPPFKLAILEQRAGPVEKNSVEYQRKYWEALRKSLHGLVNKVTVLNITKVVEELFHENLIRGRGLLARTILRAQLASPGFSHIFAALLAVLNSKLPEVGELLIKRLILQFRRSYKRNDRIACTACVKFFAHLINQKVIGELLGLELCQTFLTTPTNDSVELACTFVKEVGQTMLVDCPSGMLAIFTRFREILMEGIVDKNTQYVIEDLMRAQSTKFKEFPGVMPELDLLEEDDRITHEIDLLDESIDPKTLLDVFHAREPNQYAAEEAKWTEISAQILGLSNEADDSDQDEDDDSDAESDASDGGGGSDGEPGGSHHPGGLLASKTTADIVDMTEQDLINLRKTIYLCIMSSAGFEECVHKLLKLNIPEGAEKEVCNMLIDCCTMERVFERFFALQGERLAKLREVYSDAFSLCFQQQYDVVHRLETNKLRNLAKFFAHLFATDAIPWTALQVVIITEEATTSASRIFVKNLFQELCNDMSLVKLNQRLREPELAPFLEGLFPHKSLSDARFAINFFTAIGLSPLADPLRDKVMQVRAAVKAQS